MHLRGIVAACLTTAALTSCSSVTGADLKSDPMSCQELADEASSISEGSDVELLKVRDLEVDLDKQESGWDKPSGAGEVVVLRCLGRGVWSDNSNTNVRLELSVDSDDEAFVSYQGTR